MAIQKLAIVCSDSGSRSQLSLHILTSPEVVQFPGNQPLVEVGISAAGMHEKGAERNLSECITRRP